MRKLKNIPFWLIKSSISFYLLTPFLPVQAQIVPDGTLPINASVTSEGNTTAISGGTQAGSNLFHSFEQFSIPTGGAAYFNNSADVQNIISRVTGRNVSNIDGLIRANGAANLFLLNPNGFIFGENAALNIGGSFVASTASSLNFTDGTQFSATAPQTAPLLTVNVPTGLQFGSKAGSIQVQGNGQGIRLSTDLIDTTVGLRVQPNKTLALVGGNIDLVGGTLKTAGGRIELGSVAEPGFVSLIPANNGYSLGYLGISNFGDIKLSGAAAVDASGLGGGDIQTKSRQLILTNGSQIESSTLGFEPGGTLSVNALESVELIGTVANSDIPSALAASVAQEANGSGGNLIIKTGRLSVRDGALISANTSGKGSAGNITIKALESVELVGTVANTDLPSGLFATVFQEATGNGGNLTLETGQLSIRDGAAIQTGTFGTGSSGSLTINALKSVELIGTTANKLLPSALAASVERGASGNGGNLTLETERLSIRDGAVIQTGTFGTGLSGNLTIDALESVELIGTAVDNQFPSGLFTTVEQGARGNGGNLTLETGRLTIRDGAVVSASTSGEGSSGSLTVNAKESVELSGISADNQFSSFLAARSRGLGNGGDLRINTGQLTIQDGSEVTVSSTDLGRAGQLNVQASSIYLGNYAKLSAENFSSEGGNILLQVQDLLLLRGSSQITTEASKTAQGGNISVNTNTLAILENSNITANAFQGRGGNIQIDTQGLFQSQDNSITASSQLGINGTVQINTLTNNFARAAVNLPTNVVDVTGLVAQTCAGGGGSVGKGSGFVVTGSGLPLRPTDPLRVPAVILDTNDTDVKQTEAENHWITLNSKIAVSDSIPLEAQGLIINSQGQLILTAQPSDNSDPIGSTLVTCYAP